MEARMRRRHLFSVLIAGLLVLGTGGCPFVGLEYEDDLVGDYAVWAVDVPEQAAVVRKTSPNGALDVVSPMVFAYGHDNRFIIAQQHPMRDWKVDATVTHWFVVEVETGKVHGPLTQEQYGAIREEIGVPAGLSFTKRIDLR